MFGHQKKSTSCRTAKQRLLSVVSRDRANVSAEFLLKMTADFLSTAVRYIEPDYDGVSVTIERKNGGACLCAKFPVVSYKKVTT